MTDTSLAAPPAADAPVDKSGDRVRAMFAGIAPRYDLLNHLLSLNVDRRWRRFAVRTVPPAPGDPRPILDVCTGTGDLALLYAAAVQGATPPVEVVGCDFCPPMLERARRKAQAARGVRFEEADAQALPYPADTFQVVTCAFGLRNVADHRRGLAEMVRVAAPGGRVAVLEFSRPTLSGLRQLYLFYFRRVLPMLGQWVSPNRFGAYRYLPESVLQFPDGAAVLDLFRAAGLTDGRHFPRTFGVATLYVGTKPAGVGPPAAS